MHNVKLTPVGDMVLGFIKDEKLSEEIDLIVPDAVKQTARDKGDRSAIVEILKLGSAVDTLRYPLSPGQKVQLKGQAIKVHENDDGMYVVFSVHAVAVIMG